MNKISKIMRFIWHGLYYALTFRFGLKFALRCREVVKKIDLDEEKDRNPRNFRFYLHISLCQACANYLQTTIDLKNSIRASLKKKSLTPQGMNDLNEKLLEKFAR